MLLENLGNTFIFVCSFKTEQISLSKDLIGYLNSNSVTNFRKPIYTSLLIIKISKLGRVKT